MGIQSERSGQTPGQGALLRDLYAQMLQTRLVDSAAWAAYQQRRSGFVASCRGHEAAQVGSAACIEVGQDFTLPYYRDLGVVLTIGMTPEEVFRTYVEACSSFPSPDPAHARPLPVLSDLPALPDIAEKSSLAAYRPISHWGYHKHNLVNGPAPVATQIMHAAGIAFACKLRKVPAVTIAYCGDGATAEPDFHEGISFAALHRLPALFICEQDSIPVTSATLGTLKLPAGLHYERVDGSDVLLVYQATREALQRARAGQGPTLLEITVMRATPGSPTGDLANDPLLRCQQLLQDRNAWSAEWARELEERLQREIERTLEDVLGESFF